MTDQQNLLAKMRDMTRQLMNGGPQSATAAIQQALQDAGLSPRHVTPDGSAVDPARRGAENVLHDINPPPTGTSESASRMFKTAQPQPQPQQNKQAFDNAAGKANDMAGDGARGFGNALNGALESKEGMSGFVSDLLAKLGVPADGINLGAGLRKTAPAPLPEGAQFISGSYANQAGSRQYKLYVPSGYHGQALPLVVMLHGCTQDPDDFAAGTQMNSAAESQQCLVLYPQQSQGNNSSKCWNWFNAVDQQRDTGEPSILAGMTREIMERYKIDRRQVYIAGLSAGGAMAAIMGMTYPDLYAGVAVHSGLPYGAASDLPSALAAMKSGMTRSAPQPQQAAGSREFKGIPIIVFHGDADHTVNMRNGEQVIAGTAPATSGVDSRTREKGQVENGHAYTRTVHRNESGKPVAEHWLIHGFGHAWAGGSAQGSYTDARGPDATGEMMRFFSTHANPA